MKRVAVWGKFDRLHQGHIEFLRHARNLGDELYVVVIPNNKVKENSGVSPIKSAEERKRDITKLNFVTDVYIDCLDQGLESILKLKPDIFAFGHDQKTQWEKQLQQCFSSKSLNPEYIYLGIYNKGFIPTQKK